MSIISMLMKWKESEEVGRLLYWTLLDQFQFCCEIIKNIFQKKSLDYANRGFSLFSAGELLLQTNIVKREMIKNSLTRHFAYDIIHIDI